MKVNMINTAIFAGAAAAVALVAFSSTDAEARGGSKEIYQETYTLDKPLHGVEGHTNDNYYCTYKRFPVRKCKWNGSKEVCKVVKWRLEQTCY